MPSVCFQVSSLPSASRKEDKRFTPWKGSSRQVKLSKEAMMMMSPRVACESMNMFSPRVGRFTFQVSSHGHAPATSLSIACLPACSLSSCAKNLHLLFLLVSWSSESQCLRVFFCSENDSYVDGVQMPTNDGFSNEGGNSAQKLLTASSPMPSPIKDSVGQVAKDVPEVFHSAFGQVSPLLTPLSREQTDSHETMITAVKLFGARAEQRCMRTYIYLSFLFPCKWCTHLQRLCLYARDTLPESYGRTGLCCSGQYDLQRNRRRLEVCIGRAITRGQRHQRFKPA
jgi:hypothetical protein